MNNTITEVTKENKHKTLYEREYSVLLNYLNVYVNIQKALVDKVVILVNDDSYELMNNKFEKIQSLDKTDDTLLDELIKIAPKRIIIYNSSKFINKELLKILVAIFRERLELYIEN